jgi:hypothetical protein
VPEVCPHLSVTLSICLLMYIFTSLLSYLEEIEYAYEITLLSVCVCVSIPTIVARQRLGRSRLIVARQRLGKNFHIVARQRLGKNPPIVAR